MINSLNIDLEDQNFQTQWATCPEIIALSAPDHHELIKKAADLKYEIAANTSDPGCLKKIASDSRQAFSASHACRLLLIVELSENPADIISETIAELENNSEAGWSTKNAFYGKGAIPGKLAFAFPGQGSQYTFMGRDLIESFPEVRKTIHHVNQIFDSARKLSDLIYPEPKGIENEKTLQEDALRSTDVAQPAIGAISAATAKVLDRFGIRPDAACGHSFGELTALFASGRFDEESFLLLAAARGKYMAAAGGTADKGGMLAVKAPLEQLDELIRSSGLDVVLANRNSQDQGVLSGPTDAINRMKDLCKQNKIRATILPVSAAFHSPLIKEAAEPFKKKIETVAFSDPLIPVYSNTTGAPYPDSEKAAKEILGSHLQNPVNFVDEINNMYQDGVRIFVEAGPRTVLTGLIKAILADKEIYTMASDASSGRRSGTTDLAKTLCALASVGYPVKLTNWKTG